MRSRQIAGCPSGETVEIKHEQLAIVLQGHHHKSLWFCETQLWGSVRNSNLEILQRPQAKFLLGIVNASWYVPSSPVRNELGLPYVERCRKSNTLVFYVKNWPYTQPIVGVFLSKTVTPTAKALFAPLIRSQVRTPRNFLALEIWDPDTRPIPFPSCPLFTQSNPVSWRLWTFKARHKGDKRGKLKNYIILY